ncbi:hypothetical protein [Alistipes sp.]|uniref:hypothetical protein n=1 Tax=Alistipes sp. TaxID=1872444 RepID=UPI00399B1E90
MQVVILEFDELTFPIPQIIMHGPEPCFVLFEVFAFDPAGNVIRPFDINRFPHIIGNVENRLRFRCKVENRILENILYSIIRTLRRLFSQQSESVKRQAFFALPCFALNPPQTRKEPPFIASDIFRHTVITFDELRNFIERPQQPVVYSRLFGSRLYADKWRFVEYLQQLIVPLVHT